MYTTLWYNKYIKTKEYNKITGLPESFEPPSFEVCKKLFYGQKKNEHPYFELIRNKIIEINGKKGFTKSVNGRNLRSEFHLIFKEHMQKMEPSKKEDVVKEINSALKKCLEQKHIWLVTSGDSIKPDKFRWMKSPEIPIATSFEVKFDSDIKLIFNTENDEKKIICSFRWGYCVGMANIRIDVKSIK
jgi:hypothetical protein